MNGCRLLETLFDSAADINLSSHKDIYSRIMKQWFTDSVDNICSLLNATLLFQPIMSA